MAKSRNMREQASRYAFYQANTEAAKQKKLDTLANNELPYSEKYYSVEGRFHRDSRLKKIATKGVK
jgi:phage portal protein BeeE